VAPPSFNPYGGGVVLDNRSGVRLFYVGKGEEGELNFF